MNRFSADYSSSLPSTPDAATPLKSRPLFADMSNQFSTTPAGPPPSSAASFTPADPPPASAFGSSQLGSGVSKLRFTKSPNKQPFQMSNRALSAMLPPARTKNGTPARPQGSKNPMAPNNSLFSNKSFSRPGENQSLYEEDDEEGYEDQDGDDMDMSMGQFEGAGSPAFRGFTSVNARPASNPTPLSLFQRGAHSVRKPRFNASVNKQNIAPQPSQLPRKGKESVIPSIARDLASRAQIAALSEPDDMILDTENNVGGLEESVQEAPDEDTAEALVSETANELLQLWQSHVPSTNSSRNSTGIGPKDSASPLEKAYFLASLLLSLHHPHPQQSQSTSPFRFSTSKSLSLVPSSKPRPIPISQVLVEWLDDHHQSYGDLLRAVKSASPNCTSHDMFWDAVQSLVLRGKLQDVIQLFSVADFRHAVTALDDGEEEPGYRGAQLQTVQGVIYRARQVLDGCPGSRNGDWHVDGSEWDLYRKRVSNELEYLSRLGEGEEGQDEDDNFEAENFGIRKGGNPLLKSTERSQSNVPESIYQNLRIMYSILLGSAVEIIAQSLDWLEATAALTIWWDGSDEDTIATWSLNVSRSHRPNNEQSREDPYLSRLSAAFLCVTDPDDSDSFQINTMSILEVGLASVLQGNIEGVLSSLRAYSLTMASAVAEVASAAGWLNTGSSSNPAGLDQDDLMVLSYGVDPVGIRKDDILVSYAEALFEREELRASNGTVYEGWELSISIASRLDDLEAVETTTSRFLDQIELTGQKRMDKLVSLCTTLGLEEEARKISERYADYLVNDTTEYGTALFCYARSHAAAKIRVVIDLLVSYCLVQSAAYPTVADLDRNLKMLLDNPKGALLPLVKSDPEAAEMLSFYVSGYACLRKFYGLRDEEILAKKDGQKPTQRPLGRKTAAAKALTAVINSAADSIYGGLYDPGRQSAIQVDALLTLLGEATAFLAHNSEQKEILTSDQMYALLAAIEDLQTVNSRVYDATEECLQAALRNWHGSAPPSPRDMLKKSVSSGTNSNFSFSMIGSEMMARSEESARSRGGKSVGGSGVLVDQSSDGKSEPVERGWDWRATFKSKDATGADVLKTLRMGIARELSIAELR